MSIDLIVVRSCAALVVLIMFCNFAAAQSGNRLSKVLENSDETKSRTVQRVPQAVPAIDPSTTMDAYYPQSSGECCCNECESGCGSECAQGCHECTPSRKSKIARLKDWIYDRRKPVTGFCVEEVQYGANAGCPSYDYNSHGAWWTGAAFGPGHGKLAALKAYMAQRRAIRKASRQNSCGCGGHNAQGCDSGCCVTSDLPYPSQYGGETINSYPLLEDTSPPVSSRAPTRKD